MTGIHGIAARTAVFLNWGCCVSTDVSRHPVLAVSLMTCCW